MGWRKLLVLGVLLFMGGRTVGQDTLRYSLRGKVPDCAGSSCLLLRNTRPLQAIVLDTFCNLSVPMSLFAEDDSLRAEIHTSRGWKISIYLFRSGEFRVVQVDSLRWLEPVRVIGVSPEGSSFRTLPEHWLESGAEASATGLPYALERAHPLAILARKSGWDVNVNLEGLDARRIRTRLEGSSLFSLCPMEMGGCLAGVSSFLTQAVELGTSALASGGASLELSGGIPELSAYPVFQGQFYGRVMSQGPGYELGIQSTFRMHRGTGVLRGIYSTAGDYRAGGGVQVPGSRYTTMGVLVQTAFQMRKASHRIPRVTWAFLRTLDAGYPGTRNLRILQETRQIFSLDIPFSMAGKTIQGEIQGAYQPGFHSMAMQSPEMGITLISRAYSQIGDVRLVLKKGFFGKLPFTAIQWENQGTVWNFTADLEKEGNPASRRYQVRNARTMELSSGLHLSFRFTRAWKGMVSGGMAYLSWRRSGDPAYSLWMPAGAGELVWTHSHDRKEEEIFQQVRPRIEWTYRLPTPVEFYREHVILPGGRWLLAAPDRLRPEQLFTVRIEGLFRKTRNSESSEKIRHLEWEWTGFSRWIRNYVGLQIRTDTVSPMPDAAPEVVSYQNAGTLWLVGAGMAFRYFQPGWEISLLTGWTWGEFLHTREPAPYIAPFRASLSFRYQVLPFLNLEGIIHGMTAQPRVASSLGQIPSPAYITGDFILDLTPVPSLNVQIFVRNLADVYYFLPTSYGAVPEPGRYLGISFRWDLFHAWVDPRRILIADYQVPMACERCARKVQKQVERIPGVLRVVPDIRESRLRVWLDAGTLSPIRIRTHLENFYGTGGISLQEVKPAR